jgi:hypothetical protein
VRVDLQRGVGPDAQPVHGDPVQPVAAGGGRDVLPLGAVERLPRCLGHLRQLFDVGLASKAVPPTQPDEGKGYGDQGHRDDQREQLGVHQAAPTDAACG